MEAKRFFINNLNTFICESIFKELKSTRDDENDGAVFFGTYIHKDDSEKPKGIKKMLKRSKPRLFSKYLSECDVLIYDLHSGNLNDVEFGLEALKKFKNDEEKIVILISSVLVWANTPEKIVEINAKEEVNKEGDEAGDEADAKEKEEPEEPSVLDETNEKGQDDEKKEEELVEKQFKHLPLSDADYASRIPAPNYEKFKQIEDKVLEFKQDNVKVYIIGAGILYGMESKVFEDHFKSAWLQSPKQLKYINEGYNLMPTIHIKDLARLVDAIVIKKPADKPYLIAVDKTPNPTQKSIIEAISRGMGTGEVKSAHVEELKDGDTEDIFKINLKMKPTEIMGGGDIEETGEEGGAEAVESDFAWHCKNGIADNIEKLAKEFCEVHGLKPIKVFVGGPPISGKSHFARILAEHYNVPHIHIEELLQNIQHQPTELGAMFKKYKDENPGQKYPDTFLYDLIKDRLLQNDCKYRGYILDGFPRAYDDAVGVFMDVIPEPKEDEDDLNNREGNEDVNDNENDNAKEKEEEKPKKRKLNADIYPDSVVLLVGEEKFILSRAESLQRAPSVNKRQTLKETSRRLTKFFELNKYVPMNRFFQERKMDILEISIEKENNFELIESMRIYIEREGRPFNYLPSIQELNKEREIYLNNQEDSLNKKKEDEQLKILENNTKEKEETDKLAELRMRKIYADLAELDEAKKLNTREFLMKNIIPVLTEGLIDVCKVVPIDPIDYLAEFLFRKSSEK